eukprot:TRINITY_DN3760_c0_g1_i1.p1 TRINITY_DN3760_c0_g1~~TRINITY_DN3760_c0_g1_i1.p1  ORF type:complete len:404 (+),score=90.65 TRINITY_DN3760_c0_g1_i1:439-1650(+)
MCIKYLAVLLVLTCFSLTFVNSEASNQVNVYHLSSDFNEKTEQGKWILIFHAPWCPHCKRIKPQFERAAEKANGLGINFGMVDCDENTSLCRGYKIRGYPTLKYMVNGKMGDYMGGREEKDFVSFAERVSSDPVLKVEKDVEHFVDREEVNFILFGNGEDLDVFSTAASFYQHYSNIKFGFASPDALKPYSDVTEFPQILLINDDPNHPNGILYEGSYTIDGVDKWISTKDKPFLNTINEYTWTVITASDYPTALVFSEKSNTQFVQDVRSIAVETPDYIFAIIDPVKYERLLGQFGVSKEELPAVVVYDSSAQVHYYNNTYPTTTTGIKQFLLAVSNGEIEADGPGAGFIPKLKIMLQNLGMFVNENLYISIAVICFITLFLIITLSLVCTVEGEIKKEKTE